MAKKNNYAWATTMTPFSKMLALGMFIVLPIAAFYYGRYYQKQIDQYQKRPVIQYIINPQPTAAAPQNGRVSCTTNADCPAGYSCAQPGPVIANGTPHHYCWKNGTPMPL